MKKILTLTILLAGITLYAQNESDALRYSRLEFFGDARFNAMGGAFGALGANMAGLSVNPGGIGVYKSSDFSFTPAFHYNYSNSKLDGNSVIDGKLNFHFSNIGIVGTLDGFGSWKSFSMGMGYNRTSNFNTSISAKGKTDKTMLNTFTDELNAGDGTNEADIETLYPFSSNLAYQNYLVNPTFADSLKYDNVFQNSKNINQDINYFTQGGTGEVFFTMGGNYNDKLFIGGTMGIPTVRYIYERNYKETSDELDTLTDFKSFSVYDYVKTTGVGLNFKLGMIYKINDWVRIGTAFHTPTIYGMTDNYQTTVKSEMKNGSTYELESPFGTYNYMLTTPYRFVGSAAFVIGEHGVISSDYEFVDYSMARLRYDINAEGDNYDFMIENQNIRNSFTIAHNVRIGTEWRLDPFRIRAGYRYQGNPLNGAMNTDLSSSTYSFGLGIKQDNYYIDIAHSIKVFSENTTVIEENNDFAATSLRDNYFTFTLGFRF